MRILFLFSAFFFFFLLDHLPLSETCSSRVCEHGEPDIRFPFRLKQFQSEERCVCPGFDLSCNAQYQTTLSLPLSGEFIVDSVDYIDQVIWLRDPDGCLPKRLQDFTPQGSIWTVQHYTNSTFFKCPTMLWSLCPFTRIPCLDGRNYYVVAVATDELSQDRIRYNLSQLNCSENGTIKFPTVDTANTSSFDVLGYTDTFGLTWAEPSCGGCEAHGHTCGFKGEEGMETKCIISHDHAITNGAKTHWWIFVAIGIPCFILIASLFNCISNKFRARGQAQRDQTDPLSPTGRAEALVISGMDTTAIELYPKTQIGDGGGLMPRDKTCSICLSEYKMKEVLRTIPECKHSFHAHCIDPWLRRNASCPVYESPGVYEVRSLKLRGTVDSSLIECAIFCHRSKHSTVTILYKPVGSRFVFTVSGYSDIVQEPNGARDREVLPLPG